MGLYLAYPDPDDEEIRCLSVSCLAFLVISGKERIGGHAKDVFEPLIRLLYETSSKISAVSTEEKSSQKLFELCSQCLCQAAEAAPKEFKSLSQGLTDQQVNPLFDSAVRKAIKSASNLWIENREIVWIDFDDKDSVNI